MQIGQRIKAWRKFLGMTQEVLAGMVGVAPSAISQFETGTTEPTHDRLALIASAFGISMARFWGSLPSKKAVA